MNVYMLAFVFGYVLQCILVCVERVTCAFKERKLLFYFLMHLICLDVHIIACVVVSVSVGVRVRNWCLLSSGQHQEMFLGQCHLAIK